MFEEGQIADGPNGPLIYRGGRWYPLQQAPQMPVDPTFQYQGPQAQAEAARAQAEAERAQAQAPYAAQLAQAEAARAQAEAEKARAEAEGGAKTQAQKSEERDRVSRLNQLVKQINRVEDLYRQGPGATEGLAALLDYLPLDANAKLDVAGAQLSQQGLAAFRVPGTGTVSDRDAIMFDRGNLPTAATRDVANEEIIRGLKARVEEELASLGQPAPQWGNAAQDRRDDTPVIPGSALDVIRTYNTGGGAVEAVPLAPVGTEQYQTIANPALARAHDDLVQTLIAQGGGRLDPQAYAAGRMELAREFGVALPDPGADMRGAIGWANAVNQYLDAGGRTIPTDLTQRQIMTASETAANNLVNNPLGAALIGAANTASFGTVEALAPGQYMALGDAQPVSQLVGEIGGAIGGTGAIGALGRGVASRVAPQLLQGGGRGQFARNVGADATFGGIFGGVTEGDPLTGAALGGVGSIGGQGLARGIGAGVGGLQRTQAAQALRDRGVPISVARQIGMGRVEDLAGSLPFANEAVRNRQLDSFTGLDRAMMQQGGESIGFVPSQAGRTGIDEFDDAVSDVYTSATSGRVAGVDTQTYRDLRPVMKAIRDLPEDYRAAAETIFDRRVLPALQSGQITGEQFQQALRGIKQARANAGKNPSLAGFEQEFRDALTGVETMLTGTMTRGAGPDVAAGLNAANAANRGLKVSENTILDRAAVGSQAGGVNVATPGQWLGALRKAERDGFGQNPGMRDIAEAGQATLPSTVPNSGTADRLIALGVLGGAGGVGSYANYDPAQGAGSALQGGQNVMQNTLAVGGLLGLLGTRRGQRVLEQILITRPQAAQQIGQGFRRRAGLFGSGGAAVGLNQQ